MFFQSLPHTNLDTSALADLLESGADVQQANVGPAWVYFTRSESGKRQLIISEGEKAISIDCEHLN